MKTIIHVNGQNLRAAKKGAKVPVFTAKDYRQNRKGNFIIIEGPSVLKLSLNKPHKSGAVAWIETHAPVKVNP